MRIARIGMTFVKCTRFLDVQSCKVLRTGIQDDRKFMILDASDDPISPSKHAYFLPVEFRLHQENLLTAQLPDGRSLSEKLELSETLECIQYLDARTITFRRVLGHWNQELSAIAGRRVSLVQCERPGDGIDVLPLTLLTTGSLRVLAERLGRAVDPRRFRSNLLIENDAPNIEDQWEGKHIKIGEVVIRVRSSVPRCIVTQLNPESGKNDLRTVPVLMEYRDKVHLPDGILPTYKTPGFASYAEVITPGSLRVGDAVELLDDV